MRDYCLHEASSRAAYGRLTWAFRVWRNWRMRNTLKQLAKMADGQLYDLGMPRSVLNQLIAKPLSADISWEYERERLLAGRYGLDIKPLAPRSNSGPQEPLKPKSQLIISGLQQY